MAVLRRYFQSSFAEVIFSEEKNNLLLFVIFLVTSALLFLLWVLLQYRHPEITEQINNAIETFNKVVSKRFEHNKNNNFLFGCVF